MAGAKRWLLLLLSLMVLGSSSASTILNLVAPPDVLSGMPVNLTINGSVSAGDRLGFVSGSDCAATLEVQATLGDSGAVLLTFPNPGSFSLCYGRASEPVELIQGITLVVDDWKTALSNFTVEAIGSSTLSLALSHGWGSVAPTRGFQALVCPGLNESAPHCAGLVFPLDVNPRKDRLWGAEFSLSRVDAAMAFGAYTVRVAPVQDRVFGAWSPAAAVSLNRTIFSARFADPPFNRYLVPSRRRLELNGTFLSADDQVRFTARGAGCEEGEGSFLRFAADGGTLSAGDGPISFEVASQEGLAGGYSLCYRFGGAGSGLLWKRFEAHTVDMVWVSGVSVASDVVSTFPHSEVTFNASGASERDAALFVAGGGCAEGLLAVASGSLGGTFNFKDGGRFSLCFKLHGSDVFLPLGAVLLEIPKWETHLIQAGSADFQFSYSFRVNLEVRQFLPVSFEVAACFVDACFNATVLGSAALNASTGRKEWTAVFPLSDLGAGLVRHQSVSPVLYARAAAGGSHGRWNRLTGAIKPLSAVALLHLAVNGTMAVFEGEKRTVGVSISEKPESPVIVRCASSAPSRVSISPDRLIFYEANFARPQAFEVASVGDQPGRDLLAAVECEVQTADLLYATRVVAPFTVAIVAADSAGGLALSPGRFLLFEGETKTFTAAVRSAPLAAVGCSFSVACLNCSEPIAGTTVEVTTEGGFSFAAGEKGVVFGGITAPQDFISEAVMGLQMNVSCSSADAAYDGIRLSIPLVVVDEDEPSAFLGGIDTSELITVSEGSKFCFSLALACCEPRETSVVALSADQPIVGLVPSEIVFSPGNWTEPQRICVYGTDNSYANDPVQTIVRLSVSGESVYDPILGLDADIPLAPASSFAVLVLNEDIPELRVSRLQLEVFEGSPPREIEVSLATQPAGNVSLSVSRSPGLTDSIVSVSPFSAVFTPESWLAPLTIVVEALEDGNVHPNGNYTLSLSVTSTDPLYGALDPIDVSVAYRNDDRYGVWFSRRIWTVVEGGSWDAVEMKLLSVPASAVTIKASTVMSNLIFSPESVTFDGKDWDVEKSISIRALDDHIASSGGKRDILVEFSSLDSEYGAMGDEVLSVDVVELTVAVDVPQLGKIRFENDGFSITATFTAATQFFGVVPCEAVFEEHSSFGPAARCVFSTPTQVAIQLGASVAPGDVLTLVSGAVHNAESDQVFASGSMEVRAPEEPPVPTVRLGGASTVGRCTDVVLDSSTSGGSCNLPFAYSWSVYCDCPVRHLESLLQKAERVLEIPSALLRPDEEYVFSLSLENVFRSSAKGAWSVVVREAPLPQLSAVGPSIFSVSRNEELVVAVEAAPPPVCEGEDQEIAPIDVSWTGDINFAALLEKEPASDRIRRLSAELLDAGTYRVFAHAAVRGASAFATAVFEITVTPAPIVARIAGGSRSVGIGQDLLLDASGSVDLDFVGKESRLQCSWTCQNLTHEAMVLEETGVSEGVACFAANSAALSFAEEARVLLPSGFFANAPVELAFTVGCFQDLDDRPYRRYGFDTVSYLLRPGVAASVFVSVAAVSVDGVKAVPPLDVAGYAIASSDELQLQAKNLDGTAAEGFFSWKIEGDLDFSALGINLKAENLIVNRHTLTPGVVYKFSLSTGNSGRASATIQINSPPFGGSLTVVPDSGRALSTKFALSADAWVDRAQDGPLMYEFRLVDGDVEVPLGEKSRANRLEGLFLPVRALVVVYVTDRLGATSREGPLLVDVSAPSAADTVSFLDSQMEEWMAESASKGGGSATLQLASALLGVLKGGSSGGNCGEHGSEVKRPSGCTTGHSNCWSICQCEPGWGGAACSVDSAALEGQRQVLTSVVSALVDASAEMEKTPSSIAQQAGVAASASEISSQLDADTRKVILALLTVLAADSSSTQGIPALTLALSNILKGLFLESAAGSSDSSRRRMAVTELGLKQQEALAAMAAIDTLTRTLLRNSVEGGAIQKLIGASYLMDGYKLFGETLGSKTLKVPLSEFESARPAEVTFPPLRGLEAAGFPVASTLDVSVLRLLANPFDAWAASQSIVTTVLRLRFWRADADTVYSPGLKALEKPVHLFFPMVSPPPKTFSTLEVLEYVCPAAGFEVVPCTINPVNYSCPRIGAKVRVQCPTEVSLYQCRHWDEVLQDWTTGGCEVTGVVEGGSLNCSCSTLHPSQAVFSGAAYTTTKAAVVEDGQAILFSRPSLSVAEGSPLGQDYAVSLNLPPIGKVQISIKSEDGRVLVSPNVLHFAAFDTGPKSVTVTAVDDSIVWPSAVRTVLKHTVASLDFLYDKLAVDPLDVVVLEDDAAGILLSTTALSLTEGSSVNYSVALQSPPSEGSVVVTPALSAAAALFWSPANLSFNASTWLVPQSVEVRSAANQVADADVHTSLLHEISAEDPVYAGVAGPFLSVTVVEDDEVGLHFNTTLLVIREDSEIGASLEFSLLSEPDQPVTVSFKVEGPRLLHLTPKIVTIPPSQWSAAVLVRVTPENDGTVRGTQRSYLKVSTATATASPFDQLDVDAVTVTVIEDDGEEGGITVSPTAISVLEGQSGSLAVYLRSAPTAPVTVAAKFSSGYCQNAATRLSTYDAFCSSDAECNIGYICRTKAMMDVRNGTGGDPILVFDTANWASSGALLVSALADMLDEPDSVSTVVLLRTFSDDPLYAGLKAQVTVHVLDNNSPLLALSAPQLRVIEADEACAYYTVQIACCEPWGPVEVEVEVEDGQVTAEPAALVFLPETWREPQTVCVVAVDDPMVEAKVHESTIVHTASAERVVHSTSSLRATLIPVPALEVQVVDDDAPSVQVFPPSLSLLESGAGRLVLVSLGSVPTGPVTVSLAIGSVALASRLSIVGPSSLLFSIENWSQPQTFEVVPINDDVAQKDITGPLLVDCSESEDPQYKTLIVPSIPVAVKNEDVPGIFVSRTQLRVAESGFNDTYSLRLTSEPKADVTVHLHVPVVAWAAARPELLVFGAGDWEEPKMITVSAENEGVAEGPHFFLLRHIVYSIDAAYQLMAVPNVNVTILETAESSPAPRVLEARFGPSGVHLSVEFDRSTNKAGLAGLFSCSEVLADAAKLGTGPRCSWGTAALLSIRLGEGFLIRVGDSLSLRDGVIRASNGSALFSRGEVVVQRPLSPPVPVPVLVGDHTLGLGENLTIDASGSSGGAGMPMLYTWSVYSDAQAPELKAFLRSQSTKADQLCVSRELFLYGARYEFYLTLENSQGMVRTSDPFVVTKAKVPLPFVAADGPNHVTVMRTDVVVLRVLTNHASELAIAWSGDIDFALLEGKGDVQFPDPWARRFPGKYLPASSKYSVTVAVSLAASPAEVVKRVEFLVEVGTLPLVCAIRGGQERVLSFDSDVLLDGSGSSDPDGLPGDLQFSWSCSLAGTGAVCKDIAGSDLALAAVAAPVVPKHTLPIGRRHRFALVVSKDSRSCSTSTTVVLVAGDPPRVEIDPLVSERVNPFARLALMATAVGEAAGNVSFSWVAKEGDVSLDNTDILLSSAFGPNLVFKPSVLTPGATYSFEVSGAMVGRAVGSASIKFVCSVPPTGRFIVEPSLGIALLTSFSLRAVAVEVAGDHAAVAGGFLYEFRVREIGGSWRPLAERRSTNSIQLALPVGDDSTSRNLEVAVAIFDRDGAVSVLTSTVQSFLPTDTAIAPLLASSIEQAPFSSGDRALQLLDASLTVINAVNQLANSSGLSCSGRGISTANTECVEMGLPDCPSRCICSEGWYGTDCQFDSTVWEEKKQVLGSILGAFEKAQRSIEPSPAAISQQAFVLAAATSDPLEIPAERQRLALDLAARLAASSEASQHDMTPRTGQQVADALAGVMETALFEEGSSTVEGAVETLSEALDALSAACLSQTVPGEGPVTLKTPKFVLEAQRREAYQVAGSTLGVSGARAGTNFIIPPTVFDSQEGYPGFVDVKTRFYVSDPFSFSKQPLRTRVVGCSVRNQTGPMEIANLTDSVLIEMPFTTTIPVDLPIGPRNSTELNYTCYAGIPQNLTFDCPGGNQFFHLCNISLDSNVTSISVNFTCPLRYADSRCLFWDRTGGAWSGAGCKVHSQSNTRLVCACDHLSDFSGNWEITSLPSSKVVLVHPDETFYPPVVRDSWLVIATICVVYAAVACMCAIGRHVDRQDSDKGLGAHHPMFTDLREMNEEFTTVEEEMPEAVVSVEEEVEEEEPVDEATLIVKISAEGAEGTQKRLNSPQSLGESEWDSEDGEPTAENDRPAPRMYHRKKRKPPVLAEEEEGDVEAPITVQTLQPKAAVAGGLFHDAWEALKTHHTFLSLFYTFNPIYTRPKRTAILLLTVMGHMIVTAYLMDNQYPEDYEEMQVESADIFLFGILAAFITLPFLFLLTRLFRMTGVQKAIVRDALRQGWDEYLDLDDRYSAEEDVGDPEELGALSAWSQFERSKILLWVAHYRASTAARAAKKAPGGEHERLAARWRELRLRANAKHTECAHNLLLFLDTLEERAREEVEAIYRDKRGALLCLKKSVKRSERFRFHRFFSTLREDQQRRYIETHRLRRVMTRVQRSLFDLFLKEKFEASPAKALLPLEEFMIYFLAVLFALATGLFVVLFGLHHGPGVCEAWLWSLLFATAIKGLVGQPVRILFVSSVLPHLTRWLLRGVSALTKAGEEAVAARKRANDDRADREFKDGLQDLETLPSRRAAQPGKRAMASEPPAERLFFSKSECHRRLNVRGLLVTCKSSGWGSAVAVEAGLSRGCGSRYWEFLIVSSGTDGGIVIGVANDYFHPLKDAVGADEHSWGVSVGTGDFGHCGFKPFAEPFTDGDTLGILLDMNVGSLTFFKNGQSLGAVIAAGITQHAKESLRPALSMGGCGKKERLRVQCLGRMQAPVPSLPGIPIPTAGDESMLNPIRQGEEDAEGVEEEQKMVVIPTFRAMVVNDLDRSRLPDTSRENDLPPPIAPWLNLAAKEEKMAPEPVPPPPSDPPPPRDTFVPQPTVLEEEEEEEEVVGNPPAADEGPRAAGRNPRGGGRVVAVSGKLNRGPQPWAPWLAVNGVFDRVQMAGEGTRQTVPPPASPPPEEGREPLPLVRTPEPAMVRKERPSEGGKNPTTAPIDVNPPLQTADHDLPPTSMADVNPEVEDGRRTFVDAATTERPLEGPKPVRRKPSMRRATEEANPPQIAFISANPTAGISNPDDE